MYELLIVSRTGETDGLVSRVEKALKSANAQELKSDKLGKKVLAYPIKKQTEGDYIIFKFSAEGSAISDLTDMLRLEQEALLRYLITVEKTRKLRKKIAKKEEVKAEVKEEKKPKVTVTTKVSSKVQEKKPKAKTNSKKGKK